MDVDRHVAADTPAGPSATRQGAPRRGRPPHRDFRLFWIGQSASLVGSAVSFVALPLVAVLLLDADARAMGVLTAVERLPPLLVGPLIGPLVDNGSRWRLMLLADAGRAVLLGWIPLAWWLGVLALWHLVVIAFGVGALTLLFNVAYQAFLPNLVAADRLAEGNARLAASQSASEVAGPGLASLLIGAGGPPAGVLADAASYLLSLWCLLRLRYRDTARRAAPRAGALRHRLVAYRAEVVTGFALLRRDGVLRTVVLSNAVLAFFAQLQAAIYFVFLVRTLHLGPGLIGVLFLVAGGIGFLTAIWSDRLATRYGVGVLVVAGQLVMIAGGVLLAVAGGPTPVAAALIIAGEACFGAGMSLFGVGYTTMIQIRTGDEVRGRVFASARFLGATAVPVAAIAGGLLGEEFGVRFVMLLGGFGMLLGLAGVWRRRVLAVRGGTA